MQINKHCKQKMMKKMTNKNSVYVYKDPGVSFQRKEKQTTTNEQGE